jgi:hypothetical protein
MTTATELQAKYNALAIMWRPLLELKVNPMNPNTSDEERVFVLMELLYRTLGPRPGYGKLCWQLVFGDTRSCPGELVAPSQYARIDDEHRLCVLEAGWRKARSYTRDVH